jgi:hypothetical protein
MIGYVVVVIVVLVLTLYQPNVIGLSWSECNMAVNGQFVTDGGDMNLVYADVFRQNPNLKVLVYSGDVDILTVAYQKTQFCLDVLSNATGQVKVTIGLSF